MQDVRSRAPRSADTTTLNEPSAAIENLSCEADHLLSDTVSDSGPRGVSLVSNCDGRKAVGPDRGTVAAPPSSARALHRLLDRERPGGSLAVLAGKPEGLDVASVDLALAMCPPKAMCVKTVQQVLL